MYARLATILVATVTAAIRFQDDLAFILAMALVVTVGCCIDYFIWALALRDLRGDGTRATMSPTTRQERLKEGLKTMGDRERHLHRIKSFRSQILRAAPSDVKGMIVAPTILMTIRDLCPELGLTEIVKLTGDEIRNSLLKSLDESLTRESLRILDPRKYDPEWTVGSRQ